MNTPDTHFEQLLQERDEVRPLLHVIERSETLLDLLCVLLVLRIRGIPWGRRSYSSNGELELVHDAARGSYISQYAACNSLPSVPLNAYHGDRFEASRAPTLGELAADIAV